MKTKLMLCFAIAALALATAKSYTMKLYQPAKVGATELQAGEYQVEVNGQTAVITQGKLHVQAAVTVETAGRKYEGTSAVVGAVDGKSQLQEIHLGGTATKLIVSGSPAPPAN